MYSDIEDLIESQPADKTMHEWEQSTTEAEHIIKPLTVEGQTVPDSFMGSGTTVEAAIKLVENPLELKTIKNIFQTQTLRHIKPLTVECQIVLDPFMGYGTNGIRSLKLNRKFIGIETDKEHYSRADSKIIRHLLNLEFKIFSLFALKYPYFL